MTNHNWTQAVRLAMSAVLLVFLTTAAFAQQITVSGNVKETTGEPIIGASVLVKGTTTGTITDLDGNFTLSNVAEGAELEISFIGYVSQTIKASTYPAQIILELDAEALEEVVVVGYGVQKKSVVTASIAKMTSEDLEGKAVVRMDNALKGLAAGVNVTSSSGQPGSSPKVRIRGTGTINDSDPLYIVDGMPIEGGLDFVNPNDIESIEVLKDAASGAIYGARAANGVVLVTTKKGKVGKPSVNYNFSYGLQSRWKKRDMVSATDYAILQNEKYMNAGYAPLYADPYNLTDAMGNAITGYGTDWQDLVFYNNAPVVNHDVSLSGATEKLNYYLSLGYYDQDGIVGGNYGASNYDRLTLRSNTTYNVMDDSKYRNWLNKLDINVNVSYMRTHSTGVDENSEYGSVLGSALYLSPILTPTLTGSAAQAMIETYADYDLVCDANGNPYTIPGYGGSYQEMNNPLAMLSLDHAKNYSHKIVPKVSADLQIWDNLKYHFSYSADLSFYGYDSAVTSCYYLSGNNNASHTSATSYKGQTTVWQVENTLTYDKTFGQHSFAVVLGQSAYRSYGNYLYGNKWGLVNTSKPSLDYATGTIEYTYDDEGNITGATIQQSAAGGTYTEHRVSSLFARLSYNYAEKYMLQATVRRDGSSRFGANHKYGIFPSVSAGWNIIREPFMDETRQWLSNMKLRASWGKNGNDNIADFGYTSLPATGNNAIIGNTAVKANGTKATRLANDDLKWEESVQTDIGLDLSFFNNSLTFGMDYYIKRTNGMIIEMAIPSYVGESKPLGNVGDMENSGVEFEIGYKWNISDVHFSVKGNATYLHNELINLGNDTGYLMLDTIQGIDGGGTRAENGQPFPFFYGYKTAGIFQNMQEVYDYVDANGNMIQPNAVPGDVRFVDVNGDGSITTDDRTNIGNGTPKWTYGLNLDISWKGFDFNIFFQGVAGVQVFDATYRTDVYSGNYPSWMLGRWTGEGTSYTIPRLVLGDSTNWVFSDLYVHDGSYCRIKNISLGYTIPQKYTQKARIDRLRVYVSSENLVTMTSYWGFDPEMSSGSTSLGIDRGVYPQARTFTVGANLTF